MIMFYTISGSSTASVQPISWSIGQLSQEQIVGLAENECRNEGSNLADLIGIEWVGVGQADEEGEYAQYEPARPFNPGEHLEAAMLKLNDDNRSFKIFTNKDEFMKQVKEISFNSEFLAKAQKLVDSN